MLPCAYDLCVVELVSLIESLRPRAVLMTGQAARRGTVCVERFARKATDAAAPDNRGAFGAMAEDGPDAIETTTPARQIAQAIRGVGVAARVSTDAGDYVCNHLYYHALRRLNGDSTPIPAVFIHLPATPEQSPRGASRGRLATCDAVRALRTAIELICPDAARAPSDR